MIRRDPELLYVHPVQHSVPRCIPMGAPGVVNSAGCGKLGLYSDEVTEEHVRGARIVAFDVHWYDPLWPVERLAARYKSVHPEIRVVAGGYTASVFADRLVEETAVDYVIRGDSERPFRLLVEAILGGGDASAVPNLTARDFSNGRTHQLDAQEFGALDYSSLDWFPSRLAATSDAPVHRLGSDIGGYPFLPVLRGCPYDCSFCYGSAEKTRDLFGRSHVVRSAAAVRRDLERLSEDPRIPGVAIPSDFIDLLGPAYAGEILGRRYDLNLYYEFFNLPSFESVERLCGAFDQVWLNFSLYGVHGESERMLPVGELESLLSRVNRAFPHARIDLFNPRSYYRVPAVFSSMALAQPSCSEAWHLRTPDVRAGGEAGREDYRHFRELTRRRHGYRLLREAWAAFSGLFPPEERRSVKASEAAEDEERGKTTRGCLPRFVVDERLARTTPGGEREEYRRWMSRFVSPETVVLSLSAVGSAGELSVQRAAGEPGGAGTIGLLRVWKRQAGLGDLLLERETPDVDGLDVAFLEDLFAAPGGELLAGLARVEEEGVLAGRLAGKMCLADSCRWAAGRPCPGERLERAVVDPTGKVRTCFAGRPIGEAGEENQVLLGRFLDERRRTALERGCEACEAAARCPRCPCLGRIPAEVYCDVMRRFPSVGDVVVVPQILRLLDGTLSGPGRLRFEVGSAHRLLEEGAEPEPGREPRSALAPGVRVAELDGVHHLCDTARLGSAQVSKDVLGVVAAAGQGDFLAFVAEALRRSSGMPSVADLQEVMVELQSFLRFR